MKTHFALFQRAASIPPDIEEFAAVLTMQRVIVCQARKLAAAEDRALALDEPRYFIGIVLPRLCTRHSMEVEAQRIHDALFGPSRTVSISSFEQRVMLGGYDAVHDKLRAIASAAKRAFDTKRSTNTEQQRAGAAHLALLLGRGGYGERARRATT